MSKSDFKAGIEAAGRVIAEYRKLAKENGAFCANNQKIMKTTTTTPKKADRPAPICSACGGKGPLKRGWNNAQFCSQNCETREISDLHGSMPGAGPVPRRNWVPSHIEREISRRWED
jgi:hypothetical protein